VKRLRFIIRAFLFFYLFGFSSAYALEAKNNLMEFGVSYFHYNYSEIAAPPFKSDEEGNIPGICFSYTYRKPKDLYIFIFGEIADGNTDYDGSLQDGTPHKDRTKNFFSRYDLSLGYTFSLLKNHLLVSPFIGIGEAGWKRDGGNNTEFPYTEKYTWDYVPVGVFLTYEATKRLSIGTRLTYRHMFDTVMNVTGSMSSLHTEDIGDKYEYDIQLPIYYKLGEHFSLDLVPSYNVRKFSKGPEFIVQTGPTEGAIVYEPASRAIIKEISLRLGYLF
jgi:hypothetical protein